MYLNYMRLFVYNIILLFLYKWTFTKILLQMFEIGCQKLITYFIQIIEIF